MKRLLFLLLWSLPLHADVDCKALLEQFSDQGTIVIAIDYDGTAVDTDAFLVKEIIPRAVEKIADASQEPWKAFLRKLEENGARYYPQTYTPTAWACADFGFPCDHLPGGVISFWEAMAEYFHTPPPNTPPLAIIPAFEAFTQKAREIAGDRIEWVLLTARRKDSADRAVHRLNAAGYALTDVLHAGDVAGKDSEERAQTKARQLREYRSPTGHRISVFIDNDPANLEQASQVEGLSVLWMQATENGHALVPWNP